ncbi:rhomboid family intramembrane serine protease [bacterium]|nr:rhomboid family intramembrane serine protease [bacterium]
MRQKRPKKRVFPGGRDMLLPYRVKNPPKRFPVATICIIAINILVYIFTTNSLIEIREEVVTSYAFAFGASPAVNFICACFLHADPFHLIGNMLFLWVFGPPVEDRLGIPKYILLYFATGLFGDILQAMLDTAFIGHTGLGIGASGCIMGVVGAYWYLFSWSTVCVFYWFGWIWHGVWEVQAIWIIGLYILMDVGEGLLFGSMGVEGGVANFAHVGGGAAGAILCLIMRIKRDSSELSDAKAIHSEMKDLSMLPLHALETMSKEDNCNPEMIRALIKVALRNGQQSAIDAAMTGAGVALIDKDPALVGYYLTDLRGGADIYKPVHLLHLAGTLDQSGDHTRAIQIYNHLFKKYPTGPDAEAALYRAAVCYWSSFNDKKNAQVCLNEMAKRFPNGSMLQFGRKLWNQILSQSGKTSPG